MDNLNIADNYFLKANDNYDYNMEELIENIGYALSYDEEHAPTWCLQGRLMMYELKKYKAAIRCFEKAIFFDPTYIESYKFYSLLLIWIGDFEKAQIIINKGKRVKGMPISITLQRLAMIQEYKGNIGKAIRIMSQAKLLSLSQNDYDFFTNEVIRLNRKVNKPQKEEVQVIPKKVKPTLLQMASQIITRLW
ncbi:MAG: hypothetical protein P1U56_03625 [Saprospiraceae bacterium]|nr:hypothetical protein [Saprospiraceae bacterium]